MNLAYAPQGRGKQRTAKTCSGRTAWAGWLVLLAFTICLFLHPVSSEAKNAATAQTGSGAGDTKTETADGADTSKYVDGVNQSWVKKDGYCYYYKNGKPLKGFKKIGKRYYYFDKKGRQMTGWRQVGKVIRYFQIKNGKKGYMLSGQKINGVKLKKDGTARVTFAVKQKLNLLLRFQKLIDSMARPLENKKTKLVRAFKYARDTGYRYITPPSYSSKWDQTGAEIFLASHYGDCLVAACGFAYMANAIGYKNVTLRYYDHCHCEINKRIYDPGFAQTVSDYNYTIYFDRPYSALPSWGTGPGIATIAV